MVNSGMMICSFFLKKRYSRGNVEDICKLNSEYTFTKDDDTVVSFADVFEILGAFCGAHYENANDEKKSKTFSIEKNSIKYSDTEEEIKKKLGNPKNEEEIENGIYKYKKLSYEGLELTLKENYDKYMLVKAEITSRKYKTSRNIRVKDRVLKVIRKYKVENSKGTYIYGNYTTKSLDNLQIKENIYLAVRNDKEIVYVYRDTVVLEERPNIARLNITYSKGKVEKIVWSYDTE